MSSRGGEFKEKLAMVVRQLTLTDDEYVKLGEENKQIQ